MSILRSLSLAAAMAVTAMPASAITINSAYGYWESSDPAVLGVGSSLIQWGTDAGYGLSGYQYDAPTTPFEADVDTNFVLGTFTHQNNPISGNPADDLNTANLLVQISVDGVSDAIDLIFSFEHWETPNRANPCANGEAHGVGVNSNGCADRVIATFNEASVSSFILDGIEYTLSFSGLMHGSELLDEFWTRERQDNSAQLIGHLTAEEIPQTPLPASSLLLLGGLAGLALARRRR